MRSAPLFAALDDEAAAALIELDEPHPPRARRRAVPRGRPGRPALRHRRGQDQARPHQRRRPREPPGDPRPGRDVRRAQPVRPRPAHGDRHRGRRDPAARHRPRVAARVPVRPARGRHARCSRRWPGGCAAPTRRWPTWSSPTSPAASPRRCSTWPTGSAARPRTASSSPTTSPRRSSPSWSAPPARRSTRRWPTSPPAAGSGSRPAPWSCSTSSGSSAAPADRCARTTRRGGRPSGVGAQVVELGEDAEPGGRPHLARHVRVDPLAPPRRRPAAPSATAARTCSSRSPRCCR